MISYRPATPEDDADLRAMLRDNAMPAWVSLSLEREPSFFTGLHRFGVDHPFIARQAGAPAGMYVGSAHPVHLNGQATTLGYLGGLRIAPPFRRSLRNLRDGFASIRALGAEIGVPFWYTSIATENRNARRLLEAQLPGLPRYRPVGDMLTLALAAARGRRQGIWQPVRGDEVEEMCSLHNSLAGQYQFSPQLTPAFVGACGARFFVRRHGGRLAGCMALWDQQACKQVVVRGYRQPLAAARFLYNAWARLSGRIALPPVGGRLDQAYLAFLASEATALADVVALVADALSICDRRALVLGLHAAHPALPVLRRRFAAVAYRSTIYTVSDSATPPALDGRPIQPEVGIL